MSCDRNFGLIKRTLVKNERLYTIDQFINLISEVLNNPKKFSLIKVE